MKQPITVLVFWKGDSGEGGDSQYQIGTVVMENQENLEGKLNSLRSEWLDFVDSDDHDDYSDEDFIQWLIDNKHAEAPTQPATYAVIRDY